jgi:hypothetical protein
MNRNKNLLWILSAILGITLFLNISLYLYFDRIMSSGFVFDRLGDLIINLNSGSDILQSYKSFPFVPLLLSTISTLTGLGLIDVIYLPIIQIMSICGLIIFSKLFFDLKHCLMISLAVFLYIFALNPHFEEYIMAETLFFFFLYSFYISLTREKNRSVFVALSILFYLAVKFYGPPIETWILLFIGSFVLFVLITKHLYKEDRFEFENRIPYNFLILSMVIFFAYNPKFYDQLLHREISSTFFMDTVSSVVNSLLFPSSKSTQEYEYILKTPIFLRITNLLYFFIAVVPFGVIVTQNILKKNIFWEMRDLNYLFLLILIIPFFGDFILYASIGVFITRYLILIYPFISAYFLQKKNHKLLSVISIFLIIIGCIHCLSYLKFDLGYELPEGDSSSSLVSYIGSNIDKQEYILTDHHTYGLLKTYCAAVIHDPDYFIFQTYDSERYGSVFGLSKFKHMDFDYLIINLKNLDYPTQVGPPLWTYFEPFIKRYSLLNNNGLNKIYQSRDFEIYLPSRIGETKK